MNCPYCQREMQRGYMQSRDGLNWTKTQVAVPALSFLSGKALPVRNLDCVDNHTVVAYRCEACETVLIPSKIEKEQSHE